MYQLDAFYWKPNVRDQGTTRLCEVVVLSLLVAVGCSAAAAGFPSSAADARTGGGSSPGMVAVSSSLLVPVPPGWQVS